MGSLGFAEIIALAILALFVFGPERLPGMARNAGKAITALRREANKTLGELKDAAGLDDDLLEVANEARELRTQLKDVRRTAAGALMAPVNEVKAEFDAIKGEFDEVEAGVTAEIGSSGTMPVSNKPQSGPGMAALTPTASGAVPGAAPFDPDAT
ncbi:twin-arginine translocase TatA/TatE family subunit [Euzebya tangerina]|uniref:twin-arginine translocase TatA/TatE family subunit n=1 Tax=Euzebya tangerina TaxID=591198 RepID=UPI000E31E69E|nr:twin-arginine translocase TatA/TatE family subunit [Euzebya tangerina]